jgi:hypothetical protein
VKRQDVQRPAPGNHARKAPPGLAFPRGNNLRLLDPMVCVDEVRGNLRRRLRCVRARDVGTVAPRRLPSQHEREGERARARPWGPCLPLPAARARHLDATRTLIPRIWPESRRCCPSLMASSPDSSHSMTKLTILPNSSGEEHVVVRASWYTVFFWVSCLQTSAGLSRRTSQAPRTAIIQTPLGLAEITVAMILWLLPVIHDSAKSPNSKVCIVRRHHQSRPRAFLAAGR